MVNKPAVRSSCFLCVCERDDKPRAVRIGIWLCKRHWRLTCKAMTVSDYAPPDPEIDAIVRLFRQCCT